MSERIQSSMVLRGWIIAGAVALVLSGGLAILLVSQVGSGERDDRERFASLRDEARAVRAKMGLRAAKLTNKFDERKFMEEGMNPFDDKHFLRDQEFKSLYDRYQVLADECNRILARHPEWKIDYLVVDVD